MSKKHQTTRSPLKAKPVRTPGQSLQQARIDLFFDKLILPFTITLVLFIMTLIKWYEEWSGMQTSPWSWSILFAAALLFLGYRLLKLIPHVKKLRFAEEGEKIVGQYLERLREQGFQVFHDIIGDGFNIDHVLIGPAGVFTVETKTWSKPAKGETKIMFDGEKLTAWGREPDRNPLIQARAQTGWLKVLLEESTGQATTVRPVILFPGWYIENTGKEPNAPWVLNPKALPAFLKNAPVRLEPSQIAQLSLHLSRFIRCSEVEREQARRSMFRSDKGPGSQLGL